MVKICDENKYNSIDGVPIGVPFKLDSEEGLKMKICGKCMAGCKYMLDLETGNFHLLPTRGMVRVYPDACIKLGEPK